MDYLTLKYIHIVSSTLLFGTGLGSAFFMFAANRHKDLPSMYFIIRYVVIADWLFTTPAIVLQLLTGIALVNILGYSFGDGWILGALTLYFFAGACWMPVVWIQIRMRDLVKAAIDSGTELPPVYWRLDKLWILLGSLAFPAVLIAFFLMVFKPKIAYF